MICKCKLIYWYTKCKSFFLSFLYTSRFFLMPNLWTKHSSSINSIEYNSYKASHVFASILKRSFNSDVNRSFLSNMVFTNSLLRSNILSIILSSKQILLVSISKYNSQITSKSFLFSMHLSIILSMIKISLLLSLIDSLFSIRIEQAFVKDRSLFRIMVKR